MDRDARVKMINYLKKIVSEFLDTMQGIVTTPTADHLFTVREDFYRKLLDEDWATEFHHSVRKIVFNTPCVSTDIQKYV